MQEQTKHEEMKSKMKEYEAAIEQMKVLLYLTPYLYVAHAHRKEDLNFISCNFCRFLRQVMNPVRFPPPRNTAKSIAH